MEVTIFWLATKYSNFRKFLSLPISLVLSSCDLVKNPPSAEVGIYENTTTELAVKAKDLHKLYGLDKSYAYPVNGVTLGEGWNAFSKTGTRMNCVQVSALPIEFSAFQTDVKQIISSLEIVKSRSGSLSASFGTFGSGSASASSSTRINADHQNFLFSFKSLVGSTFAVEPNVAQRNLIFTEEEKQVLRDNPETDLALRIYENKLDDFRVTGGGGLTLTPQAKQILNSGKAEDFVSACGNGFVSAIHRGTKTDVVLTHKYNSSLQKKAFSAKISASGFGNSGSAKYSANSSAKEKSGELSYQIYQEGGVPIETTVLQAGGNISAFDVNRILPRQDMLIANPNAFQVSVTPYTKIYHHKNLKETQLDPSNLLSMMDYYIILNDFYTLAGAILEATILKENSVFTSQMINLYGGERHLLKLRGQIYDDLKLLERLIEKCYEDRSLCDIDAALKNEQDSLTKQSKEIKSNYNLEPKFELSPANFLESKKTVFELKKQVANSLYGQQLINNNDTQYEIKKNKVEEISNAIFQNSLANSYIQSFPKSEQNTNIKTKTPSIDETTEDFYYLGEEFYLRFYKYLIALPLPKAAYADSNFTSLINDNKTVFSDQISSSKTLWTPTANNELQKAIYLHRLKPWNEYFCQELKSAPLCYQDTFLFDLLKDGAPQLTQSNMNITGISRCHLRHSIPANSSECHRLIRKRRQRNRESVGGGWK